MKGVVRVLLLVATVALGTTAWGVDWNNQTANGMDELTKIFTDFLADSSATGLRVVVRGTFTAERGSDCFRKLKAISNSERKLVMICNPDLNSQGVLQSWELGGTVTFDGGNAERCLNDKLASGSFFYGVTFSRGNAKYEPDGNVGYGGGVYNYSQKSCFWNCTFDSCYAEESGGGLYMAPNHLYFFHTLDVVAELSQDDELMLERADGTVYIYRYPIWHCKFISCKTADDGEGGGYGASNNPFVIEFGQLADCEFINCSAGYGAAHHAERLVNCKFLNCNSNDSTGCGGAYGCKISDGCLFVDCNDSAGTTGGAVRGGADLATEWSILCRNCTFVRCKDASGYAVYDAATVRDSYVYNCLFVDCKIDPDCETEKGVNVQINSDESDLTKCFYDYGETYGFHVCEDAIKTFLSADSIDVESYIGDRFISAKFGDLPSMDGPRFRRGSGGNMIVGCYLYFTRQDWETWKWKHLPDEWRNVDPLVVTYPDDKTDQKDGRITFREACAYVQDANKLALAADKNRISFSLGSSSRVIELGTNVCMERGALTPVTIDGGTQGIAFRKLSDGDEIGIDFYCPVNLRNLTFDLTSVRFSLDKGNLDGARTSISNCRFESVDMKLISASQNKSSQNVLEVNRCSFLDGCLLYVNSGLKGRVSIAACTFVNDIQVQLVPDGPNVDLANCTFFGCNTWEPLSPPMWVEMSFDTVRLLNCVFADCQSFSELIPRVGTYIGAAEDVLDSAVPIKRIVSGVEQIGYRPKHKGSARGGELSWGDLVAAEKDVFGLGHFGPFISAGSYFVDDVENPSVRVTIGDDVIDPYDEQISLREAIRYASENSSLVSSGAVRPVFAEDAFPDGKVELSVTNVIEIPATAVFKRAPLVIRPGENQTLRITTGGDYCGLFCQEADTSFESSYTTYIGCINDAGDGGVLDTAGTWRFDRCVFGSCAAGGRGGVVYARPGAKGMITDTTFTSCMADADGGGVWNAGDFVGVGLTMYDLAARGGAGGAVFTLQEPGMPASRTLLANCNLLKNRSTLLGAFALDGEGSAGLINSIVIGNDEGGNVGACNGGEIKSAYSLTEGEMAETFRLSMPIRTNVTYLTESSAAERKRMEPFGTANQAYWPLTSAGPASGTGAYLFLKRTGSWIDDIYYSTDPDGLKPNQPRNLAGMKGSAGDAVLWDVLDTLISAKIPPPMGSIGSYPEESPGSTVNTTADGEDPHDGATTLREAIAYALANGTEVTFAEGLFLDDTAQLELENQVVVEKSQTLSLAAPAGRSLTFYRPESSSNRFFRVEAGGAIRLTGITLTNGVAHGVYTGVMKPPHDEDGGAVTGAGAMEFVKCAFLGNCAPLGSGGAIHAEGPLKVEDCTFAGNWARLDGGAIHAAAGGASIAGSKVFGNAAGQFGGGVFVSPAGGLTEISNAVIALNTAKRGGGLYCDDSNDPTAQVKTTDALVIENTATEKSDYAAHAGNVFVGTGFTYNDEYRLRVYPEYYTILTKDGAVDVQLSEAAKPEMNSVDLDPSGDAVSVQVGNAIPGLVYGLGRAESPGGEYRVETWVKADADGRLPLVAPKAGQTGFYKVFVKEQEEVR